MQQGQVGTDFCRCMCQRWVVCIVGNVLSAGQQSGGEKLEKSSQCPL
jgi:hypothetical protein